MKLNFIFIMAGVFPRDCDQNHSWLCALCPCLEGNPCGLQTAFSPPILGSALFASESQQDSLGSRPVDGQCPPKESVAGMVATSRDSGFCAQSASLCSAPRKSARKARMTQRVRMTMMTTKNMAIAPAT